MRPRHAEHDTSLTADRRNTDIEKSLDGTFSAYLALSHALADQPAPQCRGHPAKNLLQRASGTRCSQHDPFEAQDGPQGDNNEGVFMAIVERREARGGSGYRL